jgi:putative flippase GtrA
MRQDPTNAAGTSPGLAPQPLARWVITVVSRWIERRDAVIRLLRYAAVSVVATTTSLVTLGVLVGMMGVAATWANVIATAVGTVPSFELNRRWVWGREGRRSLVGQVLPFCALSFAGLVVSTLAVGVVADHTSSWAHWTRTAAILGANVAAYGTLWVVQYQLLNRYLFGSRPLPVVPEARVEVSARRQTTPSLSGRPGRRLGEGAHRPLVTYEREDHG